MTNRYEQRFLIDLAFRVAHGFPARSVVAQELSSWVEDQDLGFDWDCIPPAGAVWPRVRCQS